MAKVKYTGKDATLLNGLTIYQGFTREISDNQARKLVEADPDRWQIVGAAAPAVEEEKAGEEQFLSPETAEAPKAEPAKSKPARRSRKRG